MQELAITDTNGLPVGRVQIMEDVEQVLADHPSGWVLTPQVATMPGAPDRLAGFLLVAIPAQPVDVPFEWRHLRDVPRGWYFRLNADDPKWRLLNTEATWLWDEDARVQCRPPRHPTSSSPRSGGGV